MAAHDSRPDINSVTACFPAAATSRRQRSLIAAATLPTFTDVTKAAGIRFRHDSGAFGKKYLPETMGSGAAFLDADGDGGQDILFVNSMSWPGRPRQPLTARALSEQSRRHVHRRHGRPGLGVELYGMGAAAADYDNDGRTDLYITGARTEPPVPQPWRRALRRRHRRGRRRRQRVLDQRRVVRLRPRRAARSVRRATTSTGRSRRICSARSTARRSPTARRNRTKVRARRSIATPATARSRTSRSRRVSTTRPRRRSASRCSITTATAGSTCSSPTTRSRTGSTKQAERHLHRRRRRRGRRVQRGGRRAGRHGRRRRRLRRLGPAKPRHRQLLQRDDGALSRTRGTACSSTKRPPRPSASASLLTLTFGCFFFDYDLDGRLDIFAANGHVADDISTRAAAGHLRAAAAPVPQHRRQRQFEDVTAQCRRCASAKPMVARGAAYGDYDNDGDLDLLVTTNNGPARLLRNDGGERNHALRVKLVGTTSNRDAIGAVARVITAAGATSWQMVKTGSSYLSQSELPLTFGLGSATASHRDRGEVAGRPRRDAAGRRGRPVARGRGRQRNRVQDAVRGAAPCRRAHDDRSVPRIACAGTSRLRAARRLVAARAAVEPSRPGQPRIAARESAYRANNIGVARLEQYDFAAAIAAFRGALEIDPALALARLNLGIALFYGGEPEAARKELEAAKTALPDRPQPRLRPRPDRAGRRSRGRCDRARSRACVSSIRPTSAPRSTSDSSRPAAAVSTRRSSCCGRPSRPSRSTPPPPTASPPRWCAAAPQTRGARRWTRSRSCARAATP